MNYLVHTTVLISVPVAAESVSDAQASAETLVERALRASDIAIYEPGISVRRVDLEP